MVTTTEKTYNSDYLLASEKTINSQSLSDVYKTEYTYAGDLNETDLINANRIAIPLEQKSFRNDNFLTSQRTHFAQFNSGNDQVLEPSSITIQKGTNPVETSIEFERYDGDGNILQFKRPGGTSTVYLWGYDGQYPVAKIENATYDEVAAIITQSILNNPISDTALVSELNKLTTAPA
jgi:hypothetical protein